MRTPEHLIPHLASAERHRRRRRWVGRTILLVIIVVVGVGGYLGIKGVVTNLGGPSCRAVALGKDVTFSPEQTANAATITAVAVRRGLPPRAATIALATAIQESKLRNIQFGDRDSLGLFQQRPSQGWGSAKQILDPVYASNRFYDALVKVKGYQTMEITKVAQEVQKSANPQAYADHEQEGRILASALSGQSPGGMGCRLDATGPTRPAADVAGELAIQLDVPARGTGRTVRVRTSSDALAWSAGAWSVAHADAHGTISVTVGTRTWTRSRDQEAWTWRKAAHPLGPREVLITLR